MTMNGSRNRVKFLNIYIQCDSFKVTAMLFFRPLYEQHEIPLTVACQRRPRCVVPRRLCGTKRSQPLANH